MERVGRRGEHFVEDLVEAGCHTCSGTGCATLDIRQQQAIRFLALRIVCEKGLVIGADHGSVHVKQLGQLLNCVFDKIYLLQNTLNLQVSEMLPTYIYKTGMVSQKYGLATAGGLFNSVVSLCLVLIANTISKKVSETALF